MSQDIQRLMLKKQKFDMELWQTEKQIYDLESTYLEETAEGTGNVVKGWDLDKQTNSGGSRGQKRKAVKDSDRIFSRSSCTYEKSIENIEHGRGTWYATDQGFQAAPAQIPPPQAVAPPPQYEEYHQPRSHHKQSSNRSSQNKRKRKKNAASDEDLGFDEDDEAYH